MEVVKITHIDKTNNFLFGTLFAGWTWHQHLADVCSHAPCRYAPVRLSHPAEPGRVAYARDETTPTDSKITLPLPLDFYTAGKQENVV